MVICYAIYNFGCIFLKLFLLSECEYVNVNVILVLAALKPVLQRIAANSVYIVLRNSFPVSFCTLGHDRDCADFQPVSFMCASQMV